MNRATLRHVPSSQQHSHHVRLAAAEQAWGKSLCLKTKCVLYSHHVQHLFWGFFLIANTVSIEFHLGFKHYHRAPWL